MQSLKIYLQTSFLLSVAFLIFGHQANGQQFTIKGSTFDSVNNYPLGNTCLSLLHRSDSILICFSRSAANGSFTLRHILPGYYVLLVSRPLCELHWISIKIPEDKDVNLDRILLSPRITQLDSVIVIRPPAVVRLRGDTVEYDATKIKTQINATVEDLIKQLPGVEVDQDGSVTAQGVKIQKILVDGEEFFPDVSTVATRNLNASMVKKVQVYNKKSAQTEFTGVDDGKITKTMNLALRDESKNGYFGNVEAGSDLDQNYDGKALGGFFKLDYKLSAFVMMSDVGRSSLSFTEGQSFAGDDNMSIPSIPVTQDNFGISNATGGVPKTINGGIHYSNRWDGDGIYSGHHITGNYRYNTDVNNLLSYNFVQQILPDSIYTQSQQDNSFTNKDQHAFLSSYDFAFDSSSTLRIIFGTLIDQEHNQDDLRDTTRLNNALVNSGYRNVNAHIDNDLTFGSILWRKKLNHLGQTISAFMGLHSTSQHTYGYLYSLNNYFLPSILSLDTTDQRKDILTHTNVFEGSLQYTSIVEKIVALSSTYTSSLTYDNASNSTWDRGNGKYENFVDSLSSNYDFRIINQDLKLIAQIKKQHLSCSFGGDINYAIFQQMDFLQNSFIHHHYLDVFPSILAQYNFSPSRYITVDYLGSFQQPSISQLEPLKNNNDPLNIMLGNPLLRPSFTNKFILNFISQKTLNNRLFDANISYDFTVNSISNRNIIDSLGRNITQPINVNGQKNLNLWSSSTWDVRSFNLRLGISLNFLFNRSINFVNNIQNLADNYLPVMGLSISRYMTNEHKYHFSLIPKLGFSFSHNSINTSASPHYWSGSFTEEFGYSFVDLFDFSTNVNFTWRQKINTSDINNQSFLWNASLDKRFARNALTVKFSVNDILNQNKGLSNSIAANQIVESSYTTIRRYWMVSMIWNFASRPKRE